MNSLSFYQGDLQAARFMGLRKLQPYWHSYFGDGGYMMLLMVGLALRFAALKVFYLIEVCLLQTQN